MTEGDGIAKLSSGETKIEILNNVKCPRQFWVLNLDIGICLGFSAMSLGFPCRGVIAAFFLFVIASRSVAISVGRGIAEPRLRIL